VISQDFPGPGIFKKKIQDFPGGVGTLIFFRTKNYKISGYFSGHKPCKHAEEVPLTHLKIQQLPKTSNISALFVLYLQQCHSMSMLFDLQGPQSSLGLTGGISTCWPLPC